MNRPAKAAAEGFGPGLKISDKLPALPPAAPDGTAN